MTRFGINSLNPYRSSIPKIGGRKPICKEGTTVLHLPTNSRQLRKILDDCSC